MANIESLWHVIPRSRSGGKLHFSAFVTPVSSAGGSAMPLAWQTWPDSVRGTDANNRFEYKLLFKSGATWEDCDTCTASCRPATLLTTPDTKLWKDLFPASTRAMSVAAGTAASPKVDTELPVTSHRARLLTQRLREFHGMMLVSQLATAQVRHDGADASELREQAQFFASVLDRKLPTFAVANHSTPAGTRSESDKSAAREFAAFIRSGLNDTNPVSVKLARMAERNLYRLSARPYDSLPADVFKLIQGDFANASNAIGGRDTQLSDFDDFFTDLKQRLVYAAMFHGRCSTPEQSMRLAATGCPSYNWVEKISLLGNYPTLLRPLGLVLDFEAADEGFPTGAGEVRLCVVGRGSLQGTTASSSTLHDAQFRPRESGVLLKNGMLRVDNGSYEAVEVDADGAALKLLHMADAQARSDGRYKSSRTEEIKKLNVIRTPTMRNAGVALFQSDRGTFTGKKLRADTQSRSDLEKGNEAPPLDAEGLIRGYVPEIRVLPATSGGSGRDQDWYALTLRNEVYKVNGTELLKADNQLAIVRGAATTASDSPGTQSPSSDAHVHEALLRWQGWSLAVQLPFKAQPEEQSCQNQPDLPFPNFDFIPDIPDGKLPRLRFGVKYEFRVRTMDLACQIAEPGQNFPRLRMEDPFLRFEPVSAPAVLLQDPLDISKSPGETIDQMVVRSSKNKADITGNPVRNFCPPRSRLDLAELHGKFDSGKTPYTVGSFDAVGFGSNGDFPSDASGNAVYQVPKQIPQSGAYLPDPMTDFLVIHIEEPTGKVIKVSWEPFYPERSWPEKTPVWPNAVRVQVELRTSSEDRITTEWIEVDQERDDPYEDESVRRLIVRIPLAWKAVMRVRSGIRKDKCELMAARTLLKHAGNLFSTFSTQLRIPGDPTLGNFESWYKTQCDDGTIDMLTPSRDLTLVHATVLPLKEPAISELCVLRQTADQAAYLRLVVTADRKSTAKVDIKAKWDEWNDDPTQPFPVKSVADGEVVQILVPEERNANEGINDLAILSPPDLQKPANYQVRHAFTDTIHRKVTYTAYATSRFQTYFADQTDPKRFVLEGKSTAYVVHIRNTSRPPAPEIAYVLPIFEWKKEEPREHSFRSKRRGGGLRVYLKRQWIRSGEGERLGVVLWGETVQNQKVAPTSKLDSCSSEETLSFIGDRGDGSLRQHVTRWGADPAFADDVRLLAPSSSMFLSEMPTIDGLPHVWGEVFHGLSLEECDPGLTSSSDETAMQHPVTVVTYEPAYDKEKRLWYCDVRLSDVPAYSCFIRLTLVRYQPYSVRHAECSHVSVATFAQLPATRSLMVSRSHEKKSIDIEIRGAAAGLSDAALPNQFELTIERAKRDIDGDIHWQIDSCKTVDTKVVVQTGDPLLASATIGLQHHGHKRLVVKEFEWIKADSDDPQRPDDTCLVRRLVFADALALPDF